MEPECENGICGNEPDKLVKLYGVRMEICNNCLSQTPDDEVEPIAPL